MVEFYRDLVDHGAKMMNNNGFSSITHSGGTSNRSKKVFHPSATGDCLRKLILKKEMQMAVVSNNELIEDLRAWLADLDILQLHQLRVMNEQELRQTCLLPKFARVFPAQIIKELVDEAWASWT